MKKRLLPAAIFALAAHACTDAKQSAPTYAGPKPTTTTTQPPTTQDEATTTLPPLTTATPGGTTAGATAGTLPVDCDPNKDFAALDFPDNIKACLAGEHMFNYDSNTCTTMGKALWPCDFATLTQNLTDIELGTGPLDSERNKGGKLIGCGASNDGLRIIAQFFYKNANAPAGDCKFSALGKVVSICFQKFVDKAPAVPTTDAAKKAYVASCMAE